MVTVWKYEIEPDFVNQEVEIQAGAEILSFGVDGNDKLCFWALVDDGAPRVKRLMACVGTGWDVAMMFGPEGRREVGYVGTVVHGQYVWHLFDMGVGAEKGRDLE